MSDYFEPDYIEPETAFTLKDGKAEVSIQFSADLLEKAATQIIQNHIDLNYQPMLERKTQEFLSLKGYSKFDDLIKQVVREEFVKRYPDVVENKVNEIRDYLLKLKPEDSKDWRWDNTSRTLAEAAKAKVLEYIQNELSKEIKVTKDWLETFSRNYFANNLFRAMGMMDKMLPEAKGEK